MAQRMQQNVPGVSVGNLSSETQIHQGAQSSGPLGIRDNGNPHSQENERSTVESSSTITESSQNAAIRNSASLAISAAGAFDAAKDIMETLRSKHTNLASELEVILCL